MIHFSLQMIADPEQLKLTEAKFFAKKREKLSTNNSLSFNGYVISLNATTHSINLTQERQCKNLTLVSETNTTSISSRGVTRPNLSIKDLYVAQRARGAYIASMCQPEAAFDLYFAAQTTEPQKNDIAVLNQRLQW